MVSTASAFSSSDTAALEREADVQLETAVEFNEIWNEDLEKNCCDWIKKFEFKRICLQFPDDYLPHSNAINIKLKEALNSVDVKDAKLFILADTTYSSCCVDEVGAAHIEADCIIHFGNACCSQTSRNIPVKYVYPVLAVDEAALLKHLESLQGQCSGHEVVIHIDIGYHHLYDKLIEKKLNEALQSSNLHIENYPPASVNATHEADAESLHIFVGADNQRFANLSLTTRAAKWFIYDCVNDKLSEKNPLTAQYIRRRYFYIEKCKDAKTLGLVIGTLSTDQSGMEVAARLQSMAASRGVKTQLISVGRINPAKLANFLEIDCFVLIGCPFNNMYNSKEYYKPIVSVFEAEMALNPAWYDKYPEAYVTDFKQLLPEGRSFLAFDEEAAPLQDVSLVSGRLRATTDDSVQVAGHDASTALATKSGMALMTTTNGLAFEDRTWQGLDPALGETAPALLQNGLSGIPINYTHD